MCRILALRSPAPLDALPFVRAFAERCRASTEYQGDGWGVAWRDSGRWQSWRTVAPIWETELATLPSARLFLVHARSAFRDEGVVVGNNMPFVGAGLAFAFNGELRRVRLQAPGDTGAWRLFHLFRRFADAAGGDGGQALRRLDEVVRARSDYVRALNVAASDGERLWVHSRFGEDPEYFTLWHATVPRARGDVSVVASEPLRLGPELGAEPSWHPIANGSTVEVLDPGVVEPELGAVFAQP